MEDKEFIEGKIVITEMIQYDAIFFKDSTYDEKVCKFITDHGGIIIQRDIKLESSSPRVLNEVIQFKYYDSCSDYPEHYTAQIGTWILSSKDDENKFIITYNLPKCLKIKGEIF